MGEWGGGGEEGGSREGSYVTRAFRGPRENADTYCAIRESFRRLKVHRRFPLCKAMHPRDQSISRHFAIRRNTRPFSLFSFGSGPAERPK